MRLASNSARPSSDMLAARVPESFDRDTIRIGFKNIPKNRLD